MGNIRKLLVEETVFEKYVRMISKLIETADTMSAREWYIFLLSNSGASASDISRIINNKLNS